MSLDIPGLPDFFAITGYATRVVRIPNGFISSSEDIGTKVTDFAYGAELTATVKFLFSEVTGGIIPDTSELEIADATFVVSLLDDDDLPPKGMYLKLFMQTSISPVLEYFWDFLIVRMQHILEKILPDAINLTDLIDIDFDSGSLSDTLLAFYANEESTGFKVQVPLIGFVGLLGNSVDIECRIKNDGSETSCKIDLEESEFFSFVKEGTLWVVHKAVDFFDDLDDVISAVGQDVLEDIGDWTEAAVKQTT